jgi:flagellar M-ring protein FliF
VVKEFWNKLGPSARIGLMVGCAVIVVATVGVAAWVLRTDYDVLFANLSPQDAAALTAELDRAKLPYRIGTDGTSILVDRTSVHQTRLKLMSKDIPLHGAVGFELFNNTDFGMTEFAQKINYQRAMQGELTRTILSLSEVESVRVHLAFPEEGLFKRDPGHAKASITLALKRGQALRPEQVTGIQRLVSAAVSGTSPQDVTIVNQQGVALTHAGPADSTPELSARMELKKEIEQHLAGKASDVLERTFGAGHALASVDVVLEMNQVRVTTEDVTGPAPKAGDAATGVIVRERETIRDDAPGAARDTSAVGASSSHRETDYQVGRRVEQVVSQPGSIQRLQVLAVIKAPLDDHQLEQVKTLVAAAVGASRERGDTVVVQSMDALARPSTPAGDVLAHDDEPLPPGHTKAPDAAAPPAPSTIAASPVALASAVALIALAALAALAMRVHGRPRASRAAAPRADSLSIEQREAALARVQQWLVRGATETPARGDTR